MVQCVVKNDYAEMQVPHTVVVVMVAGSVKKKRAERKRKKSKIPAKGLRPVGACPYREKKNEKIDRLKSNNNKRKERHRPKIYKNCTG